MDKNVQDFNVRLRTIRIRDLVVWLIITSILTGILMFIFPVIYDSDDLFYIVFLLIVVILFIWALIGTNGISDNFKNIFEPNNKKEILYVLATNLLFAFLFTYMFSAFDIFMGITDPTWISLLGNGEIHYDSAAIILDIISSIIFAPILEELIFRGVLFNRLKIRTGIIPAMIISSLIFAIGHEFGGITSAFLFGICMCILYLKTDNILITMTVHFLNNVLAVIIYYTNIDFITAQMPWIIPSTIISIIGTVYLVKYIIKETKNLKKVYN